MENKFFLEKNRSKFSNNVEGSINVGLSTKTRFLPNENIEDTFSLYEQYKKERDDCSKFRLIATINPICSNVLFNMKSEILINEGSSACTNVTEKSNLDKETYAPKAGNTSSITYRQAIKDTEYSHENIGNFDYHCGIDIFNNHMLRNDGFAHVNKCPSESPVYNTISDFLRDGQGNIVTEDIHKSSISIQGETELHLYHYDSILSMKDAYANKCKEVDGWWGFTNPSNINIPNFGGSQSGITINQMLCNHKSCEFIDLYPDRTLFSFTPKYNKFRNRIEKNWDYCITYPYKSDKAKIDEICGGENQSIKANAYVQTNANGVKILELHSLFKHNLSEGQNISIYYYDDNEFKRYSSTVQVMGVGDLNGEHTDKIFSIKYNDVSSIAEILVSNGLYYKKNRNGFDCSYYFRIFKKILNKNDEELRSDINKAAFAKNIYGDNISQLIFLDDIDVDGLVDNRGRKVTEVYLTIVKRNAGHEKWYGQNIYTDEDIEYSHCFGEVTSGLDFSGIKDEPFDYNVHYLNNINTGAYSGTTIANATLSAWGKTLLAESAPKTIESGITIDMNEFYGDVVEFDATTAKETVISNVYYRFNTQQRETFNDNYRDIYEDVIISDDYDVLIGSEKTARGFVVDTYYRNDYIKTNSSISEPTKANLIYANIMPEGYYYNPHTKISLYDVDENTSESRARLINYSVSGYSLEQNYELKTCELTMNSPINYGFVKGDYVALYNVEDNTIEWSEIIAASGNILTISFNRELLYNDKGVVDESFIKPQDENRKYYVLWTADSVPTYAGIDFAKMKFIWRGITKRSEVNSEAESYNTPFSNGRLYLNKTVNIFLRRQDPNGTYGLSNPIAKETKLAISNPMLKFTINGYDPIDFSVTLSMLDNLNNICY